jgi:outer membrane protein
MTVRNLLIAGLATGAVLSFATLTSAQTPAAQPPPLTYGPPIAGLCTFSFNQVVAQSKVGQSFANRLKVLAQQVGAELQPQADAINTEKRTLESQASTLDRATLDARQANLELRYQNFEKLNQQRQAEMQATEQKQLAVLQAQVEPIVRQLFQARQCSTLLARDSGAVLVSTPGNDISGGAVTALDAKIQTLTFDREHIDPNAPQQPAGR